MPGLRHGDGTVKLRWMSLARTSDTDLQRWQATLDLQEQDRARRFRFAADRDAFVAAHALARSMVAAQLGADPGALRFVAEPGGKPRLVSPCAGSLQFNLSHTRTHVACGIALCDGLGVDIEAVDRTEAVAVAERYFTPSEVRLLHDAALDRRNRVFARLWTLKEAFLKATGDGLRHPLDEFSFTLDPIAIRLPAGSPTSACDWQFAQLYPDRDQVIALAIQRHVDRPISLDAEESDPSSF